MQPIRYITRKKTRECMFVEGDCIDIDPVGKTVVVEDNSELKGDVSKQTLKYDYLIVACGAENATFGIPGVREHSCFLKEIWDARKIRTKLMDCLETAAFPGQTESEVDRLLNMVVVGGGPTVSIEITEFVTNLPIFLNAQGVEYAAELHDFLVEDLTRWYPDMAGKIKITLIEATNNVLPMFSKQLIEYTEKTFAENKVTILNNTMVKEVKDKEITVLNKDKKLETIPYGLLVWATGNTARPVVSNLIKKLNPALQTQRRGLVVDEYLKVKGADDIYCLGDASATKFAPTAQVAAKQGKYLSDRFNRIGYLEADKDNMERSGVKFSDAVSLLPPFSFDNMGMLAYIGSDKAIADFPGGIQFGGMMTYYFWRSAYLSNLFSMRNSPLTSVEAKETKATAAVNLTIFVECFGIPLDAKVVAIF
ncbi:NADH:ubiquinone oxidoreductase [Clydaea vesicula]|uniref:NADH:ubiquinone reductase (non-electrogenic) n=1 Tax=Clydaea vesicula TaxID=447962 RepID=A0AAD5U461_9FUNG|nr:NADH:ubiquinone oxidoreductase [Clydaea vesicula]